MKVLIGVDELQKRVGELGEQIGRDYQGRTLTIVGVLTGSLIFLADLVRQARSALTHRPDPGVQLSRGHDAERRPANWPGTVARPAWPARAAAG